MMPVVSRLFPIVLTLLLWTGIGSHTGAQASNGALPEPPPFTSSRTAFEQKPALYSFTPNGVIMTYRPGIGWYFNPLSVAQYTLALYAGWVKGDTTAYNRMLANADWLYNNSVVRVDHIGRSFRTYEYNFPQPIFRTPAGWHSALTDATAISALFAVTSASGNSAFAERAKEILLPFEVLLADGGSRTILADRETVWYEEVAHREAPSTRILNGHIYTISLLEWYGEQALNSQGPTTGQTGNAGATICFTSI